MSDTLRLNLDPRGVARLTLSRPDKHNALDAALIEELTAAALRLAADAAVRVVVLAAEGRSFCAGGDLGWMRQQMEADAASRADQARRLASMLGTLDSLPKPLLAEVQGPVYGGGVGLLAVCDLAVGVEDSTFAMTETRLGLIPATIAPFVIARIGEPAARRLMLTARRFGAEEARTLGLLARVVPVGHLREALEEEVALLLACAPGAVAEAKALIRSLRPRGPDAQNLSVAALVARWESDEAQAGIRAFFERRDPPWVGAAPEGAE